MPELVAGMLFGVLVGTRSGYDGATALIMGGMVATVLYFASCFWWPYRRCWWCGGEPRRFDSRGNYRYRLWPCWWCRGERDNRRIGARLMGRG